MKVVSLNPGISLYLETFESNTTSDWLNQTIKPVRKCVRSTFKITKLFDKEAKNVLENGWLIRTQQLVSSPTVYSLIFRTIQNCRLQSLSV